MSPVQKSGLVAGAGTLLLALLLPAPAGLSEAAWRTAGVGLLMAVWWVTEAIPIPATSLAPLVFFPLLGIAPVGEAAAPYAHPLIFLFMGGFMVALAMERWELPRRVSLLIVRALGTKPRSVVAGFMIATAFFSMWVSNTATTLMMLPIALSVIALVERETEAAPGGPREERGAEAPSRPFSVALMLGIAYAASIGGVGTLIGTPPNAFLAGYMSESYGVEVGFAQWMALGLPLVLAALPLAFFLLTRILFRIRLPEIPGGRELIESELAELGPMSRPERRVAVVFLLTAAAWIARPVLDDWVPGLTDAGIAMAAALSLFLIPADTEPGGRSLLNWEWAKRLPWGVLILFGGGLSLASAIGDTGLTEAIGGSVAALSVLPTLGLVAGTALVTVILTELTSNTATAAAFLPIVASVAVGVGENPFLLVVPAALAASCAFMLPVATPPNAIVYGSGRLSIPQMARAGAWLNLALLVLVTLFAWVLLPLAFGVELGVVPGWAG